MDSTQKLTTGFFSYFNLNKKNSAFTRVTSTQKNTFFLILAVIFLLLSFNFLLTLKIIFSLIIGFYFIDLIFNLFLIYRSFLKEPEIKFSPEEIKNAENESTRGLTAGVSSLDRTLSDTGKPTTSQSGFYRDKDWPTYTILSPLYNEWRILPQFIKAISNIDYPKDKLQVQLLLEQDDLETIAKARSIDLPKYFEILIVPPSSLKTKPQACNYGLLNARGEYAVIYDAEDIPDKYQLKKAVLAFEKLGKNVGCIQAKLNFYNSHSNVLTKLFAADYSMWFNLVLTGLHSINAPIPLGGTSNHFKTAVLKHLGGWDSFNVTEDADLGIRLAKKGLTTAIIDSVTLEEATSEGMNWFRQRTRWIKGYLQTYLVHSRDFNFGKGLTGARNWACFQIVVGGKLFSLFVNPLMWLLTIAYFSLRSSIGETIESLFFTPVFYAGVVSLVLGNFLYMYYLMLGLTRTRQWDLVIFTLITPVYWLMISMAAFNAVYEFIKKPFYWNKTSHGAYINPFPKQKAALGLPALGRWFLTDA